MKKIKFFGMLMAAIMVLSVPSSVKAVQAEYEEGITAETEIEEMGKNILQHNYKFAGKSSGSSEMRFTNQIKIHTGFEGTFTYSVYNMPSNGIIRNLTLSNSGIASVTAYKDQIIIKANKPGSGTIKFTVKYGSKSKKFSAKLNIYKYSNPVASYKIDGKEMKAEFSMHNTCKYTLNKAKKAKFNVKAKSGWKITSFTCYTNGKAKRFKKNSANISLKKGCSVQINFTSKKTGLIENIVIWFN